MVNSNTIDKLPRISTEALLLALIRHSPVGIAFLDHLGGIIFINRRWSELTGLTEEQAFENSWLNAIHGDDYQRVVRNFKEALIDEAPYTSEFRFATTNGAVESWVSASMVPLKDDAGRVYQYLMTLTDITERKQLQTELMRSEMFLDGVLENLPAMVFVKAGKSLQFVRVNRACEKLLGIPREELIGKSDYDLFPREQADAFTGKDREVLNGSDPVVVTEEPISTLHGDLTLLTQKSRLLVPDEESEYLLGVSFDISQFVRARTAVDESKQRYKTLIENIPGATYRCLLDSDWTMQFLSSGIVDLTGYPIEDFLNNSSRTFASVIHPGDRDFVERAVRECVGEDRPWDIEYRIVHRDESVKIVQERGRAVRDGQGNVVCLDGFIMDITEKKEQEEELQRYLLEVEAARAQIEIQARELREASERAQAASKAKSEFLANMSHEIRTPLGAMLGMIDCLADSALTTAQRELVKDAKSSGALLLSVINDVLDFSKIEAGKLRLESKEFECADLARTATVLFQNQAAERRIQLKVSVVGERELKLMGDPHRVTQVMANLVSNAIKFTPEGGLIDLTIGVGRESNQSLAQLNVTVRDTGVGIAPEKQQEIFEAFEQGDASITRRFGGTGLGLTISSRLVELMGGRLSLSSAVGVGSAFTFAVPMRICEAPSLGGVPSRTVINAENALSAADNNSRRILVAEDNITNQKLITRILESAGHSVTVVGDGLAAVSAAKSGTFDVVLMDLQMPDMDGLEAAKLIREHRLADGAAAPSAEIPIVALTAHALTEHEVACREAGMDDFVSKPIDRHELLAKIAALAEQHEQDELKDQQAAPELAPTFKSI